MFSSTHASHSRNHDQAALVYKESEREKECGQHERASVDRTDRSACNSCTCLHTLPELLSKRCFLALLSVEVSWRPQHIFASAAMYGFLALISVLHPALFIYDAHPSGITSSGRLRVAPARVHYLQPRHETHGG